MERKRERSRRKGIRVSNRLLIPRLWESRRKRESGERNARDQGERKRNSPRGM